MSVLGCIALFSIGYILGVTTICIVSTNRFEESEDINGIW